MLTITGVVTARGLGGEIEILECLPLVEMAVGVLGNMGIKGNMWKGNLENEAGRQL